MPVIKPARAAGFNTNGNLAPKLLLRELVERGKSPSHLNLKQKSNMKKTTKKTSPAKAAPAAKPAAKAAPAKKTSAPAKTKPAVTTEPPATFISAKIDIGFGNQLFIRGTGPGLSWDHGVPMECVGAGLWTVTVKHATQPVTFKVLVNDLSWSTGEDFAVEPGQSVTVVPSF